LYCINILMWLSTKNILKIEIIFFLSLAKDGISVTLVPWLHSCLALRPG